MTVPERALASARQSRLDPALAPSDHPPPCPSSSSPAPPSAWAGAASWTAPTSPWTRAAASAWSAATAPASPPCCAPSPASMPLDGGDIRLAARARIATVAQEAPVRRRRRCSTPCCKATPSASRCWPKPTPPTAARLAEIHERLRAIGADAAPARAAAILAGLGFDEAAQQRPVEEFSGGWRMRVALATALFAAPDLLLLDEPTNHLDLEATLWLESWLARFPGAALLVSHDRGLLDRAVQAIAFLDRGRISRHPRRLRRIRPHPHRARVAAGPRSRAHRRGARPHPVVHRPLPLQGVARRARRSRASRRSPACRRSRR